MTKVAMNLKVTVYVLTLALFSMFFTLSGCDVFDVENPNTLTEEGLENPSSASALANGAEAKTTQALSGVLSPHSVATDELKWVGSLNAWGSIDKGSTYDPQNSFLDDAFTQMGVARWTADEAIDRIEQFDSEGALTDRTSKVRAYFYGGVVYVTIANQFDDFVIDSDRRDAGEPVGEDNMVSLYDTALDYINSGVDLAEEIGATEWRTRLVALRAYTTYSKALWGKLNPDVNTSSPLVDVPSQAVDDAEAVLDEVGNDWTYRLEISGETPDLRGGVGALIQNRSELVVSDNYVEPLSDGTGWTDIVLEDPIDGVAAPSIEETLNRLETQDQDFYIG